MKPWVVVMGIRFACPNGHQLNVKAEFAGKRAICPECQAKLLVPDVSSPAEAEPSRAEQPVEQPASAELRAPASPPQQAENSPEPPPLSPEQWHVRVASGAQYGPADEATMRQWIADGRVAADSWVWRTGWDDWKAGSEAIALVGEDPPRQPAPALATAAADVQRAVTASPRLQDEPQQLGGAHRRRSVARRNKRHRQITVALIFVTVVLACVLGFVLSNQ